MKIVAVLHFVIFLVNHYFNYKWNGLKIQKSLSGALNIQHLTLTRDHNTTSQLALQQQAA